ncbi:MAG: hypothetical protein H0V48_07450 [Nocardioidaceae bacterium]|nr:hypothetical protein [Nocardioidaceae bacterium]
MTFVFIQPRVHEAAQDAVDATVDANLGAPVEIVRPYLQRQFETRGLQAQEGFLDDTAQGIADGHRVVVGTGPEEGAASD